MTNQEKKQFLIEQDSEYMYRDVGYGGFNEQGEFVCQGVVRKLTREDIDIMFEAEMPSAYEMDMYREEFAEYERDRQECIDQGQHMKAVVPKNGYDWCFNCGLAE